MSWFKRRPPTPPPPPDSAVTVKPATEGHKFTIELSAAWQIRASLSDADELSVRISARVPYADGAYASGVLKEDSITAEEAEAIRAVLMRVRDAHREHLMHRSLDAMSLARNVARTLGEVK